MNKVASLQRFSRVLSGPVPHFEFSDFPYNIWAWVMDLPFRWLILPSHREIGRYDWLMPSSVVQSGGVVLWVFIYDGSAEWFRRMVSILSSVSRRQAVKWLHLHSSLVIWYPCRARLFLTNSLFSHRLLCSSKVMKCSYPNISAA